MDPKVVSACRAAATKYKVPLPTVIGIVRQESAGIYSAEVDGEAMPVIRWEGHYFYKRTEGAQRDRAVKAGLAHPKAGGVKNPGSQQGRWDRLVKPAMDINRAAAIESCSWGLGQVMGSHWKKLGFSSAEALFRSAVNDGIEGQVDLMMRYCKGFNLIDEMQRGDIEGFVRAYNGPGNVKNYSASIRKFIRQATVEYGTKNQNIPDKQVDGVPVAPSKMKDAKGATSYLRLGITNDARVREAQELLHRFGYAIKVDGDFGPSTKEAVMAFQKEFKLQVDGMIGPETWEMLNTKRNWPDEKPGLPGLAQTLTQTDEGKQGATITGGAVAAGGVLGSVKEQLQGVAEQLLPGVGSGGFVDSMYGYVGMGLAVIGIAGAVWYVYGWFKAHRIDKRATVPASIAADPHEE